MKPLDLRQWLRHQQRLLALLAAMQLLAWLSCSSTSLGIGPRFATGGSNSWGSPSELVDAINSGYEWRLTSMEGVRERAELPMLRAAGMWWSSLPRSLDLTLVTHLDVSSAQQRAQLRALCSSWAGPLSAAAYVGLVVAQPAGGAGGHSSSREGSGLSAASQAELDQAVAQATELHAGVEASSKEASSRADRPPAGCRLDLVLLYELYDSRQAKELLYPGNSLRNYASLVVRTDILMHVEPDFLVSKTLTEEFATYTRGPTYRNGCIKKLKYFVIPAFEVATLPSSQQQQELAARLAAGDKLELFRAYAAGNVTQLDPDRPRLHAPTNYTRWFRTTQMMYKVAHPLEYMPFLIVCFTVMPWFDVRFRGTGHGCDRAVYMALVSKIPTRSLSVHPGAWLIRQPLQQQAPAVDGPQGVGGAVGADPTPASAAAVAGHMHAMYAMYINETRFMWKDWQYEPKVEPRFLAVFQAVTWLRKEPGRFQYHRGGLDSDRAELLNRPLRYNNITVRVAAVQHTTVHKPSLQCDGIDDNVEIQEALDHVRAKGGGTVWLSEGLFVLSDQLHLYDGTTLRGSGREATVLRLRDNAPRFRFAGFVRTMNSDSVTISHMTLDGNRDKQDAAENLNYGRFGAFCEFCNNTVFDNLRIVNWFGYGIDPHGIGGVYEPSFNVTVTNCWVENNGWDGITVDKVEGTIVANNTLVRNGRHGVNIVTGTRHARIATNTFIDNGWTFIDKKAQKPGVGCGVALQNNMGFGTRDVVVVGNVFRNSSKAALCMTDVDEVRVECNVIVDTRLCVTSKLMGVGYVTYDRNACTGIPISSDTLPKRGRHYVGGPHFLTDTHSVSGLIKGCTFPVEGRR